MRRSPGEPCGRCDLSPRPVRAVEPSPRRRRGRGAGADGGLQGRGRSQRTRSTATLSQAHRGERSSLLRVRGARSSRAPHRGTRGAARDDARGADARRLLLTDVAAGLMSHNLLVLALDMQWADAENKSIDHLLVYKWAGRSASSRRPGRRSGAKGRRASRAVTTRIELRPLSRRHARAIASALLGDRASGAQEALAELIAQSGPLAEEAARGRPVATHRTRRSKRWRCRCTSTRFDEMWPHVRELAVFGQVGWDAARRDRGAVGRGRAAGFQAAEILVERPTRACRASSLRSSTR